MTECDGGGGVAAAGVHGRTHAPAACVFLSSGSMEWYTPEPALQLVREVFAPGRINLYPCSSASANARVQAGRFYDERADGLAPNKEWSVNVFSNPPCACAAATACRACPLSGVRPSNGGGCKSRLSCCWVRMVSRAAVRAALAKEQGTLRWGSQARNPHNSMVAYMGPRVARFAEVFSRICSVPGASSWALRARPLGHLIV
ncbi:hypothetical protein TSOC_005508 [Tetrabaena socialis]|uniref:Uncharacterized protein n=1 Tax=Tetrabaena socialis TaxID=47790 RepID=A0A2J8A626_9CHLO|nr:hypothetical protein TSOC_005508 [Tetrabaena socialis]|eukprot:PNH07981.1 hypothetical protein TSOC_005508 [Tetrabaena socialis]